MTDVASLLDELAVAPNMPAARCAGRHELYDATIEANRTGPGGAAELTAARDAALAICRACPELDACGAWFDSLPRTKRPRGVCAGRINNYGTAKGRQKQDKAS